jgi:NAD(P)-dependent dehydrogenase (short-subunit alcohol dehydrogenase family)
MTTGNLGFDGTGTTALVTGANSGIGFATARQLLGCGVRVIASDVADGEGSSSLRDLGATVVVADVASAEARQRLVDIAGAADFLVNSAGIIRLQPLMDVTEEDWDQIHTVNVRSMFFLIQTAVASMPDGGSIVNLSSMAARRPATVETAVYAASKAAVSSITRSWAYGLASRRIRVNSVLPGNIDTPMQRKVISDVSAERGTDADDMRAGREAEIPLGRLGDPEDVAQAITWLLSPASAYLTGQSIAVDGGLTMW